MFSTFLLFTVSGNAPVLTKLIEKCGPVAASHKGACADDIYQSVWQRFESTTGEVIKLDTKRIEPMARGAALAWTYTYVPGTTFDYDRLQQMYFTCKGQFSYMTNPNSFFDAPPRSTIGTVAAAVCRIASEKRR